MTTQTHTWTYEVHTNTHTHGQRQVTKEPFKKADRNQDKSHQTSLMWIVREQVSQF